jgi:hypothetical protein
MKIRATIEVKSEAGQTIKNHWRATLAAELQTADAKLLILGSPSLSPGQRGEAEIIVTGRPKLQPGSTFQLNEGWRTVATGRVNKIIN